VNNEVMKLNAIVAFFVHFNGWLFYVFHRLA